MTAPLDLGAIKADLAAALHPEWFVGLDHQCGDDWLAVFDADPGSLGSAGEADAALVCGGIHPDRAGRAAFIAAAPLRVAALVAEVERLRSIEASWAEMAEDYIAQRDEARAEVERLRSIIAFHAPAFCPRHDTDAPVITDCYCDATTIAAEVMQAEAAASKLDD